ncbi:hypothetical protein [Niabella ginsenosidivorans]|nr:hypothetical protein [Niabella ginsenosidivorans]
MKKSFYLIAVISLVLLFSCSKKDSDPGSGDKVTSVKISNQSDYDFKVLYVYGITGTKKEDIAKDTTAGTRKVYNLGALRSGSTSSAVTFDPKFKSLLIIFTYQNPVLGNKEYHAYVTKLGNGTNMFPYVFKPQTTFTLTLDKKMEFELL